MKRSDLAVILGILGIVVMLVIPLPTWLLDFLLILNLSVSLTILLIAMNTKEPLQFSIFPALLLITTLFRLGLNVSSTRLILSEGEAGNVIHTFGSFVIGGNAVVGFIVFLILVIIQFIVITKGAERVAEVAARFTLDAMPGKQISIDADLNSGLITEKEARERRQTIEREADFYGAMDGASKFVKGDAIASIIIVIINIIGGFIIGMTMNNNGLDVAQVMQQYTLLSVGDGLVSQIPALLISTATGLVVTRAASDSNLSQDVVKQLLAYPRMLYIVAGMIGLLGFFTPIGPLTTLPIALLVAVGGYRIQQTRVVEEIKMMEQVAEEEQAEVRSPESVVTLTHIDPIEFEFGYALIPLADTNQGGDLLDRVIMIRRQLALELGIVVPVIRIRDNIQLRPTEYVIKIKGNEVAKGELLLDHYLAMSPGIDDPNVFGIPTKEPAFGLPALWITEDMRETAEMSGYTVVDPPSVVATHLTEILKRHAHELLGRQETKQLIDSLKNNYPALVDEVTPNLFTIGDIQKVLVNLLREKVSVRDMVTILETMADMASYTKDHDLLTEYVRTSLARQITNQFRTPGQPLTVITLSPGVEKVILENIQHSEQGSYLVLDPSVSQRIYQSLNEQIQYVTATGNTPIVLTAPNIRMHMRRLVERVLPDLTILSYNELDPSIEVKSGGTVTI
ncbi:flagellar biosynthesis protein FlhA [Effusibacillus lacus]|uniref:Flagellar biosynthesis protein FlhA n=1 Tax=Effusibacillus lacus TaxID=1348429 RepID=A0A292YPX7_9BACL|nr:flagellar biosynthesis protein FlhA [Effusibacillus lacus]TCS73136.1 flagellar biosynthesis protein FlhA [Effusibacillus lacus]GAX90540.1 flagellar biosynthesis protein FlhA [Effusibacillus lacus]